MKIEICNTARYFDVTNETIPPRMMELINFCKKLPDGKLFSIQRIYCLLNKVINIPYPFIGSKIISKYTIRLGGQRYWGNARTIAEANRRKKELLCQDVLENSTSTKSKSTTKPAKKKRRRWKKKS